MAQRTSAQHENTYRMMFRFWLDAGKDEELELADYCENLKHERSFARTIRDALRLIWDLRQHHLDVLFALFPWINAWLEERAEAIAKTMIRNTPEPANVTQLHSLQEQIARLEQLLLQQGAVPIDNGVKPSIALLEASHQPRRSNAVSLNDEPEIILSKATSTENHVAYNYLISVASASGGYRTLPQEAIEYGIRKGLLPQSLLKAKPRDHLARMSNGNGSGSIKNLNVPQFSPPSFEEDDGGIDLFS